MPFHVLAPQYAAVTLNTGINRELEGIRSIIPFIYSITVTQSAFYSIPAEYLCICYTLVLRVPYIHDHMSSPALKVYNHFTQVNSFLTAHTRYVIKCAKSIKINLILIISSAL